MASIIGKLKSTLAKGGEAAKRPSREKPETMQAVAAKLRAFLHGNDTAIAQLDKLVVMHQHMVDNAQLWDHTQRYNRDIAETIGSPCPAPGYFLHASWNYGTPCGDILVQKLAEVFVPFEESLIAELHAKNVPGAIVEFGVYQGAMLGNLIAKMESLGMKREVYGFDSFEGLSQPSSAHDYEGWEKGQYAAGYDLVARNLRLKERPFLKLVKGWVEKSLKTKEAQAIKEIAYARIDVDIYEPTVDCLAFLSNRMAHGSILAFDDWAYTPDKGESKAFIDWAPTVPHYKFEWLGQCSSRFYLRVLHRDQRS